MQIKAFSSGQDMWRSIDDHLNHNHQAQLVFPGDWAREHFLRGRQFFWNADRLLTFTELWNRISSGERPDVLLPQEVGIEIERHLSVFPLLREVGSTEEGLLSIEKHLERIEAEADLSFEPHTDLEKELQDLRETMLENRRISQAAWRSQLARQAKDAEIGEVCFLQPPFSNRQFGGLLKGLGRKNKIVVWGLWSESTIEQWLEEMNIEKGLIDELEWGPKREEIDCLGTGKSTSFKARWLVSDGEISTAIKIAKEYIKDGIEPRKIALVVPSVDKAAREIMRLSRDLPLGVRYSVKTQHSPVGSALLLLSKSDYSKESIQSSFLRHWIAPETLEELALAKKEGRELEALALFAENSLRLSSGQDSDLSRVWLEGFLETRDSFLKRNIQVDDLEKFILSVNSSRVLHGDPDGIQVVSYSEAANFSFEKTILLSLDEDYPASSQRLFLFSRQTLHSFPELVVKEPWNQFQAAVSLADPVFIRPSHQKNGSKSEPSSFWRETLRAFQGKEDRVRDFVARETILALAEEGKVSTKLKDRSVWKKDGENFSGTHSSFSPTSLERYLQCPYGWFVEKKLAPQRKENPQAERGNVLHRFLENAYSSGNFDISLLPEQIKDPATESVLEEIFTRNYTWPFDDHHTEVRLHREIEIDGDQVDIYGVADRIDIRETSEGSELLVIDYKSSAPANIFNALQPLFYTEMAEEHFGIKSIGFLFLDLRTGKYSGCLKEKIPGLDDPGISYNWPSYRHKAAKRAEEALVGIRSGHWQQKSKYCPPYCPHRLISETAVSDALS